MYKAVVLKRIGQVDVALQQAMSAYHGLMGQKTELTFWLSELEKASEVVEEAVEHSDADKE